ncbi:UDP-N-acetylmuramoyl-L-alanine--D-glutamate ligase [bacterium]|nr:UDP-N-acetylmuramoyl-L-alanine--D-glutamate ligase [bacterium]
MNVKGLRFWIVGAARSGVAAAKLLRQQGAQVFVSDANIIEKEAKASLDELKIPYEEGGHSLDKLLSEAQNVVLSPSIPLDQPLPLAVRQAGIPMMGEIEVASWFIPDSAIVVGITGTNGKSTTTHYAAQLFALGQRNSVACGNYGRALCDALIDPARFNALIVELSSYQLETTYSLRPHVSIFLNLQNDHQARYKTMDEYLKAKWRLVVLTRPDGIAVVDSAVLRRAMVLGLAMPECTLIVSHGFLDEAAGQALGSSVKRVRAALNTAESSNLHRCLPTQSYGVLATLPFETLLHPDKLIHVWLQQGTATNSVQFHSCSAADSNWNLNFEVQNPVLPGEHNQLNILAASLSGLYDGLHTNIVRAQWNQCTSAYNHLPHRLEEVGKGRAFLATDKSIKRIRIINDSKATNVESTLVAVKSFSSSIRLLVGGEPKGDYYGDLLPYIGKSIEKLYPFGKAAPLVCQQLSGIGRRLAAPSANMTEAAQCALEEANDGDVILLSPACASFDEFKNFEHRGDSFRHWALQRIAVDEGQ